MREKAKEDGADKREDLPFIRNTVAQKSIAKVVLDDPDELLFRQKACLGLLEDCQNEFETDDLCPDHVVTHLLVSLGLFLAFDRKLDD